MTALATPARRFCPAETTGVAKESSNIINLDRTPTLIGFAPKGIQVSDIVAAFGAPESVDKQPAAAGSRATALRPNAAIPKSVRWLGPILLARLGMTGGWV